MIKLEIHKAQATDPKDKDKAVKSVTIVINKEWVGPDPTGLTNGLFLKALDHDFNFKAMRLAEALNATLPGGTWDRFVGIVTRMHAGHLVVNRKQLENKDES